jgi:hypothetical protein
MVSKTLLYSNWKPKCNYHTAPARLLLRKSVGFSQWGVLISLGSDHLSFLARGAELDLVIVGNKPRSVSLPIRPTAELKNNKVR